MPAIEVNHVTKEYRLGALQGLKQTLMNTGARLMGRPVVEPPLFKALDDVSFSIEPGEVVGIIGHNGAGKSTLLKMLARISTPTTGNVKVNGRVAPLIEVGAGFVGDFTGRENVYLNGSILGMSKKEIDRKFDEIVDFAEMAEFIDTPVKRYSSGMQVKLAFAVATSIESEILIVDEVLAVGDLAFQRKCFTRMEQLIKRDGRTVLLVSHNIRQVERLCSRVLILNQGSIHADGDARSVCNQFYSLSDMQISKQSQRAQQRAGSTKFGMSGEVELEKIEILGDDDGSATVVTTNQEVVVRLTLDVKERLSNILIAIGVHTTDFIYLTTSLSDNDLPELVLEPGRHEVLCTIRRLPLLPGVYALRTGIAAGAIQSMIFYGEGLLNFQVISPDQRRSLAANEGFFAMQTCWSQVEVP
ncbi:MAG: ABC transporter ATP-binding protein [Betaproteobacteria bacterium]|nr:ABC transporter ATP-binding protein [Betaproteobacteria bacterium]